MITMDKSLLLDKLRKKINSGACSIGTWLQLPSPDNAEIISSYPFDWITVDLEHGNISISDLTNIFRALELNNVLPFVRLPSNNLDNIKLSLEAGAAGLIIPNVDSAEQLIKAISLSNLPPLGSRGVGYGRHNLFGRKFLASEYTVTRPFIVAMVESYTALKNLDTLLTVEGLDAILVGPYDLSASLHCTGDFDSPEFVNSLAIIKEQCDLFDVALGIHQVSLDLAEVNRYISSGYRLIAYSIDTVFMQSSLNSIPFSSL
jgi:2-dehydro-3-deoxyglucarate aldolase